LYLMSIALRTKSGRNNDCRCECEHQEPYENTRTPSLLWSDEPPV